MFQEVNTEGPPGPFEFTVSVCAYFKTSAVTDGLVDVCPLRVQEQHVTAPHT